MDNRRWLQSHIDDINLDIEETREIVAEAQSIAEETYETLMTIANIVLLSRGDDVTTQGDQQPVDAADTGGRGGITQGVSFEFFESFLLIYSHNTHWVNFEFFQKLLTTLIKIYSLGNF